MKCRQCKQEIPENSIFCMYCGTNLRHRRKRHTERVPKPRVLADGTFYGQVMIRGVRYPVFGKTESEYRTNVLATKSGLLALNDRSKITLAQVIRKYIDSNDAVLSPSTIRSYEAIYRNRFSSYMHTPVSMINFQTMINQESVKLSPKYLSNAWALVSAALSASGFSVPDVNKPQLPVSDRPFLDYEQIRFFLREIKGSNIELACVLALHSLRLSEILGLTRECITEDGILVSGSVVRDKSGALVHKRTNKNASSSRMVPVIIPYLLDILPDGELSFPHPSTLNIGIKRVCLSTGLPLCTIHDLRRSFVSLAYYLNWNSQTTMKVGGWSELATVEKVYRKLSDLQKNADVERMREFYSELNFDD